MRSGLDSVTVRTDLVEMWSLTQLVCMRLAPRISEPLDITLLVIGAGFT